MNIDYKKENEKINFIIKKTIDFYKYKTILEFNSSENSILFEVLDEISNNNGTAYANLNEDFEYALKSSKYKKISHIINIRQDINNFKYYMDAKHMNIDVIHLNSFDVEKNFDDYYFRLSIDGIIILTDIDKEIMKLITKKINQNEKGFVLYFDKKNIIIKKSLNDKIGSKINEGMKTRLYSIYNDYDKKIKNKKPTVYVGILTYNHSKYIEECLNSVFKQKGYFNLKIIIIDDYSTDNNVEVIEKLLKKYPEKIDVEYKFIKNQKNIGIVKNMELLCDMFKNGDFYTFCEGDDFWISEERIQKFVNYMNSDLSVTVAFNKMFLYNQKGNSLSKNRNHEQISNKYYVTEDLINFQNFIGNWSCCFYRCSDLKYMEKKFFDITIYDFFFNVVLSQHGFIGVLNEFLSVYRFHDTSVWSSCSQILKSKKLYEYIFHYNIMTDYKYSEAFTGFQDKILKYNSKKIFVYQKVLIDNFVETKTFEEFKESINRYFEKFTDEKALIIIDVSLEKYVIYEWLRKYMIENNFKKNIVMFSDCLFNYINCKNYLFANEELFNNYAPEIKNNKKAYIYKKD